MNPTLTPEAMEVFKGWLKEHLHAGKVIVTFTKKDGDERKMLCTLKEDLIPKAEVAHPTGTDNPIDFPSGKTPVEEKLDELLKDMPKKERKVNENALPVFDLNANAWRSFRWDSITDVEIGDDV